MRNANYLAGKRDAQINLDAGQFAYEFHGFPSPEFKEIQQVAQDHYEVQIRVVGACVVEPETASHAAGYNEIMTAAIEQRYGTNVWIQIETEAKRLHATGQRAVPKGP